MTNNSKHHLTLNVIKKNRVYFKCTDEKGYEVKLRITPESENLEIGTYNLLVNDETVKTKYGTDIIYSLVSETKEEDGIITLKHRYNEILVEECRNLGGRWDDAEKVWVFPKLVEDEVEALDHKYNYAPVVVDITAKEDLYAGQRARKCLGYPLAKATGRDSGAVLCKDVAMLRGKITSGGSQKNWHTVVEEGTTFRLQMSSYLVDNIDKEIWDIEVVK